MGTNDPLWRMGDLTARTRARTLELMSDRLQLRRCLYEELARSRRGNRRALRRQILLLSQRRPEGGTEDGNGGVREPRRPAPTTGPAAAAGEWPVP